MECQHEQFTSRVNVYRLIDNEGQLAGFTAEVRIKCDQCGVQMQFVGIPGGVNDSYPTVSADSTELRAPVVPATKRRLGKDVN